MDLLVWLVLVMAISMEASRVRTRQEKKTSEDISDEELLEFLSDLILESEVVRKGRQDSGFEEVGSRQLDSGAADGFAPSESCIQIGLETFNKTECNEVFEVECAIVNVTKYNTDIVDKCETTIDKQCDLRMTEVPERKCNERMTNKCEVSYRTVPEPHYREECKVNVKHFCSKPVQPYGYEPNGHLPHGSEPHGPTPHGPEPHGPGPHGPILHEPNGPKPFGPEPIDQDEFHRQKLKYQTFFTNPPYQPPELHRVKRDHLSSKPRSSLPVPTQTSYEVPSRPGCRSIATKTCKKVPTYVEKKVPFSECFPVPTLDCGVVLRSVPELDCTPKAKVECKKVAKPIPYLEEEEQCEQVVYDECQEVETSVPVEECKRQRFGQESIFLHRGQVTRKEGEKRRRKLFRRLTGKDKKGSSKLSDDESTSKTDSKKKKKKKRKPKPKPQPSTSNKPKRELLRLTRRR